MARLEKLIGRSLANPARWPAIEWRLAFGLRTSSVRFSLDHLVGAGEERVGNVEAKRFRGLQIDVQLDFSDLLDWQVGGLLALEDAAGVNTNRTERIHNVASVAHEAASRDELAKLIDCGHGVAGRQRGDLFKSAAKERIGANHKPARSQLDRVCEGDVEVKFSTGIQDMKFKSQGTGCGLDVSCNCLNISPIGRIDEEGKDARRRDQLVKQF